jgi:hypothetical protein
MTGPGVQLTFDAANPRRLGQFWADVLSYVEQPPPPGFADWDAALDAMGVPADQRDIRYSIVDPGQQRPRLLFQKVPEPKTAKNRVHLDVRAAPGLEGEERMAALEAECERLVALGATRLRRSEPAPPMSAGFIVMQDPEGNELCLD